MHRDTLVFGLVVVGVVVGLAALLVGAAVQSASMLVPVGGAVVLVAFGVLTWRVAALEGPEGEAAEH